MARILVILLSILVPFLVYAAWMAFERRRNRALVRGKGQGWATLPWGWLILSGMALIVLSFLAMWLFDIDPDGWIGGPSLIQRGQAG